MLIRVVCVVNLLLNLVSSCLVFLLQHRKTKHPDLHKWFCIETIKVCCPKGTFGPDCNGEIHPPVLQSPPPPCFILILGLPMLLWKQVACVIQLLHFSNAVPSRQICKTSTCKQSISNLRLLSSPNCHSEINVGVCASGPKHELCHEQCYTWHLKGSLTKQFTMHLWHTSYYTDITLKWGSLRCEMRSQGQYRVGGHICNLSAVFVPPFKPN